MLRGVIVLEQGYDPAEQEAWVVAGVSDKTTAAARAAADMMADPPAASPTVEKGAGGPEPAIPRQVKRNSSDF